MYVDYIDLNTTCLMDHFPLPHIDQLVDVSASNELLSGWLLGVYKIRMAEEDEDKMADRLWDLLLQESSLRP